MFASRYFAPRFFAPRYFGAGGAATTGGYFGHRYFAEAFFGPRYFSPLGNGGFSPSPPSPPPPPRPVVDSGGVGSPYGPAFPRPRPKVRELYRQLPEAVPGESIPQTSEGTEVFLVALAQFTDSPLPLVMDFGSGPITVGIQASLRDAIHRQLLQDNEDAIAVILMSI